MNRRGARCRAATPLHATVACRSENTMNFLALPLTPHPRGKSSAAAELMRIVRMSEEIKGIVGIAFKINIMALNAIFLAKRAGSAALGFGVLSNELRVFSGELRETMSKLSGLIHANVSAVSVTLQESRHDALFLRTAAALPQHPQLKEVLENRRLRQETRAQRIATLRRDLALAIDDVARLVELGSVLAKSAKIEAAYGASFAAPLAQVSGEFDQVIENIRQALGRIRQAKEAGG